MAIFHLSVKAIQRSKGRSAVAAAAYRSGECLKNERVSTVHDYTKKQGVEHTEIVTKTGETITREQLWNLAETAENRKDGTTAKEYELALPSELDVDSRRSLAIEFGRYLAERHGCAVDISIHAPHRQSNGKNHHVHILTTTRIFEHGTLGAKCDKELSDRDRKKKGLEGRKVEIIHARKKWAELVNHSLEHAGHTIRIDHRSLEEQGSPLNPSVHLGPVATAMERRGIQTDRGNLNRTIAAGNDIITNSKLEKGQAAECEQQQKIDFFGKPLLLQIEKADGRSEYESILLNLAKTAIGPKVTRAYDEWISPYLAEIDKAGVGHKETFWRCAKLAQLDVKEKEILDKMKRELRGALRGTGGTGTKHDRQMKEILNAVRLYENRAEGFEQVGRPKINEWQRQKGLHRGR